MVDASKAMGLVPDPLPSHYTEYPVLPESSLLAPRLPHRPSDLSPDTFGTMHVAFLAALLASFAQAALLDSRRKCAVGAVENEYTLGGCRPILFFYARGSSEAGNMGNASYSPGPPTAQGLKNIFGCREVAVEGVDYAALLASNWLPGGTDPGEARELHDLFVDAATRCPRSILLGGGYSQGAALTHRAVEKLPAWVRARIAAIVLYGDTQNLKDSGRIPNFPEARTLIICNPGDVICAGNLTITYAHIEYVPRVPEALSFYTRAALRTHH
ncbi:cutinase 1 [Diplocarpon mali]|nr:cutinase 1 [Diplocarpon mali]